MSLKRLPNKRQQRIRRAVLGCSRAARTALRPGREATRGLRRAVRINDDTLIDRNLLLLRSPDAKPSGPPATRFVNVTKKAIPLYLLFLGHTTCGEPK